MHISAKIFLIIGGLVTVVGIIGISIGASQIDDLEDSWNTFEVENGKNGTFQVVDEDGNGDTGFTFWVKGVYEDKDGNDKWDVCDNLIITITESPDVNTSWDYAEDLNGEFYEEVLPWKGCAVSEDNKNIDREEKGLVKVGRACYGCFSGNFSFESNTNVWVTNDDVIGKKVIEDGVGLFLGFAGGFGGICCGVIFLIIGGILALTIKDNKNQAMMFMPPADNQMLAAQTAVNPNQTHMSQPDFGNPPQGGL
tara:strand:+ start:1312 stop:2067 length:756 start_codon:yes stop_codon:yes gene_type:complete